MPSNRLQTRMCTHAGNARQEHGVMMALLHRQTRLTLFGTQHPRASTVFHAVPRGTSWCATRCCPFSIAACLARPTHTVWSQPRMAARCGRPRQRISSATIVPRAPGISCSRNSYYVYGQSTICTLWNQPCKGRDAGRNMTYRYLDNSRNHCSQAKCTCPFRFLTA